MFATLVGMIPMSFLFNYMGGEIRVHTSLSLILNGIVLFVFLMLPLLVKKYNLFNLNTYIEFR
jgi:uncharacterized membrane protein YdjX (TVP38/TMEM64 family)